MTRIFAKAIHLHIGSPALGGKLSVMASKNNVLEVCPEGIRASTRLNKRTLLIPYSNVVDCELFYDTTAFDGIGKDGKPSQPSSNPAMTTVSNPIEVSGVRQD